MVEDAPNEVNVLIFSNHDYIDDIDEGVAHSSSKFVKETLSCYERLALKGKVKLEIVNY